MNNQTLNQSKKSPEIIIIGAGFSGLCMAIKLKKSGINSFKIFEKGKNLGGTWHFNTYPGCGCDVPSFLYSFSFETKYDWSLNYPKQKEILQYLEDCAKKYKIVEHIQFNTKITEAIFQSEKNIWQISTDSEEQVQANILISACGQLNQPKIPNIEGIETFEGTQFHSASWNHQYDLNGKTVATIGNGASAVQFLPIIAQQVKKLIVFHRSANWVIPKDDKKFNKLDHWIFKTFPFTTRLYRWFVYLYFESVLVTVNLQKDGIVGKLIALWLNYDRNKKVKEERLKSILKPKSPFLCKRFLLSNNYYETLQLPNVEVVSNQIKKVSQNSIVTEDGTEYPIDALIFATGFESTKFLSSIKIVGLNNQLLQDRWKDGAEAYKGIMVSGFPNFFMLYGPNTNLGSNSIIFMIESQVNYIMSCIKIIQKKSIESLDIKPDILSEFNQKLQTDAEKTVWANNCSSWYKTDQGKITNNWPYSSVRYWLTTLKANLKDFNFS
ncbi:MAG: NAD(P)/FAD-dependent oxidoreductase [Cyanobacteria bacterium P01_H01_bin.35]